MMLPGGEELVITGGNSHLVIYKWENKKLHEFYKEPLRNVIEIVIVETWFCIKFKKHYAQLYKVSTEENLMIENNWRLKMKTYKGKYRSMIMTKFRENMLMIIDISFVSDGELFEIELFDTKEKKTISNTRPEMEDRRKITNLAYSKKYAILYAIQENSHARGFKIVPDKENENKLIVSFMKKRILPYNDKPTHFLPNSSGSHFIVTTVKGSIFIGEADTLDFQLKLTGFGKFIDVCMYKQNRNVFMYTLDYDTKQFGKVSIEQGLGDILTDRDFLTKEKIKEGKKKL
jgi:hypothetical protein